MDIQTIRSKFPEYDDLADQDLVNGIHARFYPDLEPGDFYARIGHTPVSDTREDTRGPISRAVDHGLSLSRDLSTRDTLARFPEDGFSGNIMPALKLGTAQTVKGIGKGLEAASRAHETRSERPIRGALEDVAERTVHLDRDELDALMPEGHEDFQAAIPEGPSKAVQINAGEDDPVTAATREKRARWVDEQLQDARQKIEDDPTFAALKFVNPNKGAKKAGQALSDYAERIIEENPQWQRHPELVNRPWTELIADPRTRGAYLARAIGENFPNLAGGALAGLAGGATGGAGGALASTVLFTHVLEAGFSYEDLVELTDGDEESAAQTAQAVGLFNGLLETLPITRLFDTVPALRRAIGEATVEAFGTDRLLRRALTEGAKQATAEGSTEALQEVVANVGRRVYDENQDLLHGIGESAFIGALIGGGVGVGGQAVTPTQKTEGGTEGTPEASVSGKEGVPGPELPDQMPISAEVAQDKFDGAGVDVAEVDAEVVEPAAAPAAATPGEEAALELQDELIAAQGRPGRPIDVEEQDVTDVELAPAPPEEAPGSDIDVEDVTEVDAAPAPPDTRYEDARRALEDRLPEGLKDDRRLAREPYRNALKVMRGEIIKGGDINYKKDEHGTIIGRTKSVNPEWFQALAKAEGVSVQYVQTAIDRALANEKLGTKQARVVATLLDEVQTQRGGTEVEFAKEELAAARSLRREARSGIPTIEHYDEDADAYAGQQLEEVEYEPDWDAETRTLHELATEAAAVDPQAVERILDSSQSDLDVATQLWQVIANERTQSESAEADPAESGDEPQTGETDALLESYTEEDLAARAQAEADTAAAEADAVAKAEADAQRNDFTLTGSEQDADQAAAEGQLDIETAANEAATSPQNDLPEPTDAQKEAGNYKLGHIAVEGLDISIENPAGSTRSGTDKGGKAWSVEMQHHYGYFKRTEGKDGDQVDVFVKPETAASEKVYVVDQVDPSTGRFDEHKVILGAESAEDARDVYLSNYDDGWQGLGAMTELTMPALKRWLGDGSRTKKPLGVRAGRMKVSTGKLNTARPKKKQAAEPREEKPTQPIEDFGEVLHGARKHYAAEYAERMREAGEVDVASEPLSKSWPEPDYQRLLEDGADPWVVGFIRASRDEIPSKPRRSYKLQVYTAQVQTLRGFANDLLAGEIGKEDVQAQLDNPEFRNLKGAVGSRADLYVAVGHTHSLKGISLRSGRYSIFMGKDYNPPKVMWSVEKKARASAFSNWPHQIVVGDTREEAIEAFKTAYTEGVLNKATTKRQTRFEIYSKRGEKGRFYLGKKIGRDFVDLKSFAGLEEARAYRQDNQAELEVALAQFKDIPAHRRDTNAPRVGADHRSGVDVTPMQFSEAFGFRGVQFGNYVEGPKRQADLNDAYDALMDLAGVIGTPPKALSLNGELGLAFGARGRGGKRAPSAHYEPGTVVINLTKRGGAGSLAHEWFHAVDNYFSRMRGQRSGYMTDRPGGGEGVRPEMVDAFKGVMGAINGTALRERSRELDKRLTKPYWSTDLEMAARAFESYIINKLADQNQSNDYLANIVSDGSFDLEGGYPYPTAGEVPVIRAAFDHFFATAETRETDRGVGLFARRKRPSDGVDSPNGREDETSSDSAEPGVGRDGTGAGRESDVQHTTLSGNPGRPDWREQTRARTRAGPARVFRGADRPLSVADFDPSSFGKSTGALSSGLGVFFTTKESETYLYGSRKDTVHLDVRNPYLTSPTDLPLFDDIEAATKWRDDLRAQGYDAIFIQDRSIGAHPHIVVFEPDQVILIPDDPLKFAKDTTEAPERGLSISEVRAHLESKGATLPDGFEIVQSAADLPTSGRGQLAADDVVYGYFDPEAGATYLVADNLTIDGSDTDAYAIFLHEVGVHHGMPAMLGQKGFKSLVDTINATLASKANTKWTKAVRAARAKVPTDTPARLVDEETVAWLVADQANHDLGMVRRAIAEIRAFLVRLGIRRAIDADSLVILAKGAARRAHDAPAREGELRFAKRKYTPEQQAAIDAGGFGIKEKRELSVESFKETLERVRLRLRQGVVDQFDSFKSILQDNRTWMMAHLTKADSGALEAVIHYGRPELVDGAVSIQGGTQGLAEVLEPLGAEADDFLRWIAGNRADRLAGEGRERLFDEQQIAALKSLNEGWMEDGRNREIVYEEARQEFEALADAVVGVAVDTGLISQEQRAEWLEQGFYVPFYRLAEADPNAIRGPGVATGLARQRAYKKLKGADIPLNDLLSNVLLNWHHLLSASLRNQAAVRAVQAAEEQGLAQQVSKSAASKKATWVNVDGKQQWYEFDTTEDAALVLDALLSLSWEGLNGGLMKATRSFKRALTIGVTLSPEFRVANLIRDSLHSIAVVPMSTNIPKNIRDGWRGTQKGSETEVAMLAGGGAFGMSGYIHGGDPDAIKALIKKGVDEDTILDAPHKLKKLWDAYQDFGARTENINRAAAFQHALAEGKDLLEANFEARDLLDFSRTGSFVAVRALTQAVPFLNARLQGLDKLGRAVRDPKQRAQFTVVVGVYSLASVLLYLTMKDDDDYREAEEWERDAYHLFKLPGSDVIYRIPRPFEVGAIATVLERITEQVVDDEAHGPLFAERLWHALVETFSFNPLPQIVKPAIEVFANRNMFTDRPIENMSMQRLSPTERKRAWTSETAITLSRFMDNVSWSQVVLSPVQIEHLVRGYFGWAGSFVLGGVDNIVARPLMNAPADPAKRFFEYPVMKRFVRDNPTRHSKYVTAFYDQLRSVGQAHADIRQAQKLGEFEKVDRLVKEHGDKLATRKFLNRVSKRLSKINAEMTLVFADREMTADEKRQEIDALTTARNELVRDVVKDTREFFR